MGATLGGMQAHGGLATEARALFNRSGRDEGEDEEAAA
jgi:hypothetical protein